MALFVYKFSDYEHTAEREQFRALCKKLHNYYAGRDEICIFIANYNIYGCELDGILIKQDAIIAVEFKNYGGTVIAVDNGDWKLDDGTVIKGGSRKTVYQQANINHIAIRNGFKDAQAVSATALKNVNALVVFHQPIELQNRLSPNTRSWLHVCDEETFLEKVQDITSKNIDLSEDDMRHLMFALNLTEDYLVSEYSTTLENQEQIDDDGQTKLNDEILSQQDTKHLTTNVSELDSTTNTTIDESATVSTDSLKRDEREDLSPFVTQIINAVYKKDDYNAHIFKSQDAISLFLSYGIDLHKEFLITVEAEDIGEYSEKLGRFMHKDVRTIHKDLVFWEDGEDIVPRIPPTKTISNNVPQTISKSPKRKTNTTLPHWLDVFLFNILNAQYSPEHKKFEYNLDLDKESIKVYLGTYFPRSYAETFCIVTNLFQHPKIHTVYSAKKKLTIMDFGCGTGGEIMGILTAIERFNQNVESVEIFAIDGNILALDALEAIIQELKKHVRFAIELKAEHIQINSESDIKSLATHIGSFDFILCGKMGCELKSHNVAPNAYLTLARTLCPHLTENGMFILLDVTTKNESTGYFYPQEMNREINSFMSEQSEYKTILPLSCAAEHGCSNLCFIQQSFSIQHSRRKKDESRICYRVLCHSRFHEELTSSGYPQGQHIISPIRHKNNSADGVCPKFVGDNEIDSYDINII